MTLCVLCPVYRPSATPRPPEFQPACDGCRDRLRAELAEILPLYAAVPDSLEPTSGAGAKVSGTREAPIPVRVDALNLLVAGPAGAVYDPWGDQYGALPPVVVLDMWARDWLTFPWCRADHLPVPTVVSLVNWLGIRLTWAVDEHPAIDDFAREIRQTLRAIRGVVQAQRTGEPVGRCPQKLRDESRCGTQLYADPYVDLITCGRCGSSWKRRSQEWLALAAAQEEAGREAA